MFQIGVRGSWNQRLRNEVIQSGSQEKENFTDTYGHPVARICDERGVVRELAALRIEVGFGSCRGFDAQTLSVGLQVLGYFLGPIQACEQASSGCSLRWRGLAKTQTPARYETRF